MRTTSSIILFVISLSLTYTFEGHGGDYFSNPGNTLAAIIGYTDDQKDIYTHAKNEAEKGNALAQTFLGALCLAGRGPNKNADFGVHWLTEAAKQDEALACLDLGWYHDSRQGASLGVNYKNLSKTIEFSTKGYYLGEKYIKEITAPDIQRTMKSLVGSAAKRLGDYYDNRNYKMAMVNHYKSYRDVTPPEYDSDFMSNEDSLKWYSRAAMYGNLDAMVIVGNIFQNGLGVDKDPQMALELYEHAANAGHSEGQRRLGIMLWRGQGVPKDVEAATKWLEKAVENGSREARNTLAELRADDRREQLKSDGIISTDAYSVIMLYDHDERVANQQAKGKTLELGGLVDGIRKDNLGNYYVILSPGVHMPTWIRLQCYIEKGKENIIANLDNGDALIVRGRCEGLIDGNVVLRDCTPIPARHTNEGIN